MRTRVTLACLSIAAWTAIAPAAVPAFAEEAPVDLPLSSLALFTSGVGYFQHDGTVTGDGRMTMSFSTRGINDIIKSLILRDLDGGSIRSVSYASRDPVDRTLKTFAIDLTANPGLGAILAQIRGQSVELTVQSALPALLAQAAGAREAQVQPPPPERVSGTVIGVEGRSMPPYGETLMLNLLTTQGLRSVPMPDIVEAQFGNPETRAELEKALALLATARSLDRKQVEVHFTGTGKRRVRVGYLQETPVWKTAYRLALGEGKEHFLQGWAVVENATDSDWNNVSLTLVSGRPITFFMDLYTPLYTTRPEVRLQLYESLLPQTYAMALGEPEAEVYAEEAPAAAKAAAPSAAGAATRAMAAPPPPPAAQAGPAAGGGVVSAATGSQVGTLFQYVIDKPVTLPRQQSALLPIVNQNITGDRYSIYNPAVDPTHPLSAVKLRNSSGLHLMQGPITVFDGGSYAGDAQITDLPAGAEQFISYAVDLETEVEPSSTGIPDDLVTVRISRGVVISTWRQVRQQDYTIANRSGRARSLIIEQPESSGWNLVQPKEPMERARGLYRFNVSVDKGKTVRYSVIEDRTIDQSVALLNIPSDRVELFLRTKNVSQAVKDALNRLATLKQKLSDASAARQNLEQQIQTIFNDQSRIRENMGRLAKDSDLYKRYEKTLADQEDRLAKLNADLDKARNDEAARRKDVDTFIQSVDVK